MTAPSKETRLELGDVVLRFPSEADIPFIFAATRVKGFNDGMGWDPPTTITELHHALERNIKAWEAGEGFTFTIASKKNKDFLGRISIRKTDRKKVWDIGFFTHPDHQCKGIMKIAVKCILQFGFEYLNAIRIEADYAIWNEASRKVMEANGMKFVKSIERGLFKYGEWIAEIKVGITLEEWKRGDFKS